MLIGVNYHPEHWPPERWREDARLMQEAGFNVVRLGESAWSQLEPVRNKYRFRWLEDAVGVFGDRGIHSVLCTGTCSPPPWLVERHPSILPTDASGQRLAFGAWRSYCPNNPSYHKYAERITSALASHFRANPNVIAWQVDSGFGRFGTARCYCRNCAQGFREWLQRKYGSLDHLNRRWGTIFWSQTYSDWQQIPIPWRPVGESKLSHNPSLLLDYARFCSDSWVALLHLLVRALRTHAPGIPITHNLSASVTEIDPFALAADLDFATASLPESCEGCGANSRLFLEMSYSLKGGRFWAADLGADELTPPAKLLQILPAVYEAVSRGAEGIFFTRWRPAPFGAEQLKPGLLNHDGTPSRGLEAASRVARSLLKAGDGVLRPSQPSDVGLLISHESAWALGTKPEPDINYWDFASMVYDVLDRVAQRMAILQSSSALASFKVIVAPALYVVSPDLTQHLSEYVENGGTLVLTCMSGIKDSDNNVWTSGLPGGLQKVLGIAIKSFGPIKYDQDGGRMRVTATDRVFHLQRDRRGSCWSELIETRDAEVLAHYADGPYQGLPLATMKAQARGRAFYVGAWPDAEFLKYFLAQACHKAGIVTKPFLPDGVEVAYCGDVCFLVNQSFEPRAITLDGFYEDVVRGARHKGKIELPPDGALILKRIG